MCTFLLFFFFLAAFLVPSEKAGSKQSTTSRSHTSIWGVILPTAAKLAEVKSQKHSQFSFWVHKKTVSTSLITIKDKSGCGMNAQFPTGSFSRVWVKV